MRISNWKPQKFDGEFIDASLDRLEKCGEMIANDAKRRVGVVTGELKKSIRVTRLKSGENRNIRVYAGNKKAFYARWVEYGHGQKKKAHPFLRPALNASKPKLQEILRGG